METRNFMLSDLNPAPYNPRKDLKPGDTEYEAIKNSIQQFGFVEPLVVNIRDGKNVIVGGHQRYKILKTDGIEETEAVIVDLDEMDEKALNLALNKVDGDWDELKLHDILQELGEDNVIDIGFTKEDFEELKRSYQEDADEAETDSSDKPTESAKESTTQDNSSKPFEIYLSFATKEAAQAWLDRHGIEKEFDAARNVIINLTKEGTEAE